MRSVGAGNSGASEQNIRIRANIGRKIVIFFMGDYMDNPGFVNVFYTNKKGAISPPFWRFFDLLNQYYLGCGAHFISFHTCKVDTVW
jgi:hypothetical protein